MSHTVYRTPWQGEWRGGRLMEVFHPMVPDPVEAIQPDGTWRADFGGWERAPSEGDCQRALDEWARDHGEAYLREVVGPAIARMRS